MAEDKKVKPRKPGQKKLMDKLEKSKKKNADARARTKVEKGSGGTLTSRMKDVRTSRGPFPVPAVRKENVPAVRKEPGRAVVKYEPPKTGVAEYKPPKGDSGAGMARTFAGGAARAGLRGAGPVGALIAMTGPAGEGSANKPKYGMTLKERSEMLKRPFKPKNPNEGVGKPLASSTKDVEKAYQTVGTRTRLDDPVRSVRRAIPIPRAKPADQGGGPAEKKAKPSGKSSIRAAFEKEFAKNRKIGRKTFKFRGGEYSTKVK